MAPQAPGVRRIPLTLYLARGVPALAMIDLHDATLPAEGRQEA
jgi:hypothetical protein